MNIYLAIFAWLIMALILITGVVLAVIKGSLLLLIAGIVLFILAVAKIGCLSH